jgi:hypothetical protein
MSYETLVFNTFWFDILLLEKLASSCHFFKFEIWIVQTELDGEMIKIKFVDLDELRNFGIQHFRFDII